MTTSTTTRPKKTAPTAAPASAAPAKRTRVPKDPAQRAQEALDVAQRRVTKLQEAVKKADDELAVLGGELAAAVRRRDYLAGDPDLPQAPAADPATPTA